MSDAPDTMSAPLPNPNPSGSELPPEQSVPIDPASLALHYEQDDVDVRAIVRFGAAILGATVVACLALWFVLRYWTAQPLPVEVQIPPAKVEAPQVDGPGLDAAPEVHLEELLAQQSALLNSYGWIDRDAGIVHIPIDEAMQLLVEQGVPARDGPAPSFGLEPAFRMDSTGGVLPVGSSITDTVTEGDADE